MSRGRTRSIHPRVAPHAGAWIEIEKYGKERAKKLQSHPTRVRGLKLERRSYKDELDRVAPHAGAWIEIRMLSFTAS